VACQRGKKDSSAKIILFNMSNQAHDTIILDKLAQLPVPDMADAIWSNIDAMLGPISVPATHQKESVSRIGTVSKWVTIGVIAVVESLAEPWFQHGAIRLYPASTQILLAA
jgi:hypothetical protein